MVCCLWLYSCSQPVPDTLISNINLVDVHTGELLPNANVAIGDGEIIGISFDSEVTENATVQVIDGTGKYLLPGLIDGHVHLGHSGSLYARPDALDMRDTVSYQQELSFTNNMLTDQLNRYLKNGITTVMDLGGPIRNFAFRDSLPVQGPDILFSGPQFAFYLPPQMSSGDAPFRYVRNGQKVAELFSEIMKRAPDYITMWYLTNPTTPAEMNYSLVKQVADLAHENGLKLIVQANEYNAAKMAVEAGADVLMQGIEGQEIPGTFVQMLKERNVGYIPTLIVNDNYFNAFLASPSDHENELMGGNPFVYGTLSHLAAYPDHTLPPRIREMRNNPETFDVITMRRRRSMGKNLYNLSAAGVSVIAGTDAGNIGTLHGASYMRELEAMYEAGLNHFGIVQAATINPAKGFGVDDRIGSVEEGKEADLLVLTKNPLEDFRHLSEIELIFKKGRVIDPDTLIAETPEMVVQRQLNAYNARNLEAFLDTYADDIKIYNGPDELIMDGKEALRTRYDQLFSNTPNLYCEIKNREVAGSLVTDSEYVRMGDRYITARATYEVSNGKIRKVTFDR